MKRLLLGITVIMWSLCVNAQNAPLTKTDTSQLTFTKVYSDVKEAINGIAASLKVGSEHVYEVLIKQQIVNSIVWLILIIIDIIGIILVLKGIKFCSDDSKHDVEEGHIIGVVLSSILLVTLTVMCVVQLQTVVTGFINPEYGALKDIMEMIHPK